jgi:cyclophilin family peptidyl-prolyl cis-trans isomerase/HEAT repeat protein
MTAPHAPLGRPLLLLLGLVLATGCGGPSTQRRNDAPGAPLPSIQGAPTSIGDSGEHLMIARLEEWRSLGGGKLVGVLREHDDAALRERAAVALGRMPFPELGTEVTDPLCEALEDPAPNVRAAAAFALGQRGDPAGGGVLSAYRHDTDPSVRRRVIEAMTKLDTLLLRKEVLQATEDDDLGVRCAAVVGTARFDVEDEDAAEVDRALLDVLSPFATGPDGRMQPRKVDDDLRWRTLYALQRRRSELGRAAFLEYAGSPAVLDRIFAVRGLARIEPSAAGTEALKRAVSDPDWRVAAEAALGLGRAEPDDTVLSKLLLAGEHKSSHVRASVMTALGAAADGAPPRLVQHLWHGTRDRSIAVRTAALAALAEVLEADDAVEALGRFAADEDPLVRAGAAQALAAVDDSRATELVQRLASDSNLRVATTAIFALEGHDGPGVRSALHALLSHTDNGVRLAAVYALRSMADASDVPFLEAAARTAQGDIATEICFNVLTNLGAIGNAEAERIVRTALEDPRPHVRRVARETLERDFGRVVPVPASAVPERTVDPPLVGRDYPRYRRNPVVFVETTRGAMSFELFPAEAPVHVHSFLTLVRQGTYDGLMFHRVVPNFVIQGGDYRGDGNGGRPAFGDSLRQEFGTREYVRGSLGMPRNEDVDSGGSQFFVTHRPTPHLDGRYTIFGELRSGQAVLDTIEVGDRITRIRVLP